MRNRILYFLLFLGVSVLAQDEAHTLDLPNDGTSPEAAIEDVQWIQGHWKGEALGGQVEEIWSPPLGKGMMGSFKLVIDDEVKFYEIIALSETSNTLILRLKHFDSELKGWEEKEETVDFKLVKLTPDHAYFEGMTFERVSENEMNVYVRFENDGKYSEGKFNYHRYKP